MLFYKENLIVLVTSLTYLLIYNAAILLFFSTLFQFRTSVFKTLHSLSKFNTHNSASKIFIIIFFSMAGVPPFVGFFSKVLIFVLLTNSSYFILFCFFFPITFLGLYFYVQNIRFLNTSKPSTTPNQHNFFLKQSTFYYNITIPVLFFLIFGMFFVDDLILYVSWCITG